MVEIMILQGPYSHYSKEASHALGVELTHVRNKALVEGKNKIDQKKGRYLKRRLER